MRRSQAIGVALSMTRGRVVKGVGGYGQVRDLAGGVGFERRETMRPNTSGGIVRPCSGRAWEQDRGPIDRRHAVRVSRASVVAFVQREGNRSDGSSRGDRNRQPVN